MRSARQGRRRGTQRPPAFFESIISGAAASGHQPSLVVPVQEKKTAKKKKSKGSFADSLAVLKSSPKIMNLALLVMSYGVSHRLFEFAWKGQLRVLYPSAQAYQASHLQCLYVEGLYVEGTHAILYVDRGLCRLAVSCCARLT